MKLSYILRSKKLDSFTKKPMTYRFLTFFSLTSFLHFISIFLWRNTKKRSEISLIDAVFHGESKYMFFIISTEWKNFQKLKKHKKIHAVFWFFSKNRLLETIKENFNFFIKNIQKKILKYTYSCSARWALSNHVEKNGKIFAWILHYSHLTKILERHLFMNIIILDI